MRRLAGKRLYLDSNAFIFFADGHPAYAGVLEKVFERANAGHLSLVTSELTLAEELVLPMRKQNELLVARFLEALSARPYLELVPVHRDILMARARLRAAVNVKLPDAIHVATAQASVCEVFLSEDHGIRVTDDLEIIRISQLKQD